MGSTTTRETLFLLGLHQHRSTKGDAIVGRYGQSNSGRLNHSITASTSYLKGWRPRGIRCGGSFVKGCARITCQGLNRSIADSPKPLLKAQKLNTHKHTSSNIANLIIPYNLFG